MDTSSLTAQLCIAGTHAEYERRIDDARELFGRAWEAATNDYEAAIAAHYVAHLEPDPQSALHWNLVALERASQDERAAALMGSLLVSLGGAYETVGNRREAERYFQLAAEHGVQHFRGE